MIVMRHILNEERGIMSIWRERERELLVLSKYTFAGAEFPRQPQRVKTSTALVLLIATLLMVKETWQPHLLVFSLNNDCPWL